MTMLDRMREILEAEADAIRAVEVDQSFAQAVGALEGCRGKIIATGMGKAGFVARKFAAVLCSTGTPAVYIHPGEAAHGDLGLIGPGDCILAFSTSGKTREVLALIGPGRQLGAATVIAVTAHPESELRTLSDIVLNMGEIREPCPLGLTPTASMAVMSAIGDALALVLMERKAVTRQDYGLRHHGGYLGAKARSG